MTTWQPISSTSNWPAVWRSPLPLKSSIHSPHSPYRPGKALRTLRPDLPPISSAVLPPSSSAVLPLPCAAPQGDDDTDSEGSCAMLDLDNDQEGFLDLMEECDEALEGSESSAWRWALDDDTPAFLALQDTEDRGVFAQCLEEHGYCVIDHAFSEAWAHVVLLEMEKLHQAGELGASGNMLAINEKEGHLLEKPNVHERDLVTDGKAAACDAAWELAPVLRRCVPVCTWQGSVHVGEACVCVCVG